jgi:hypothetical protein
MVKRRHHKGGEDVVDEEPVTSEPGVVDNIKGKTSELFNNASSWFKSTFSNTIDDSEESMFGGGRRKRTTKRRKGTKKRKSTSKCKCKRKHSRKH